jgi:hypothetical protein
MFKTTVQVDAEGFYFNIALASTFKTAGDGYWSDVAKDVKVTDMGMFVGTSNDADEGDEAFYCDGDFYVTYDEATWDMDKDGLIYTDSLFLYNVRTALAKALVAEGVDNAKAVEIADTVHYSEQGMQDYGRVSLDAFELADFLRSKYSVLA